jgi:hypothetical protein
VLRSFGDVALTRLPLRCAISRSDRVQPDVLAVDFGHDRTLPHWTAVTEQASPMIRNFSDHAANERTFLAWVRTAIAVMAFGFLVAKFGLFLKIAA